MSLSSVYPAFSRALERATVISGLGSSAVSRRWKLYKPRKKTGQEMNKKMKKKTRQEMNKKPKKELKKEYEITFLS